jgi:hypothetical protein
MSRVHPEMLPLLVLQSVQLVLPVQQARVRSPETVRPQISVRAVIIIVRRRPVPPDVVIALTVLMMSGKRGDRPESRFLRRSSRVRSGVGVACGRVGRGPRECLGGGRFVPRVVEGRARSDLRIGGRHVERVVACADLLVGMHCFKNVLGPGRYGRSFETDMAA